jgi:hypothetical protein
MMPAQLLIESSPRAQVEEPRTALPAMLLGSGASLLLWTLLARLLWALAA